MGSIRRREPVLRMISNFRLALVVLVPLFTANAAVSQTIWHAPKGKSVMVDGTVEQGEWDDALVKDLVGLARIRIKRSEEYVFFGVELLNSDDGALDLYVSPSPGEIYDLHASAKLGERKLADHAWPEWKWWNNTGWVANTSRVDSFQKPSFLPAKVREFQISRTKFLGNQWRVMFEILTPADPTWKTTPYPPKAKTTDTRDWIRLEFE